MQPSREPSSFCSTTDWRSACGPKKPLLEAGSLRRAWGARAAERGWCMLGGAVRLYGNANATVMGQSFAGVQGGICCACAAWRPRMRIDTPLFQTRLGVPFPKSSCSPSKKSSPVGTNFEKYDQRKRRAMAASSSLCRGGTLPHAHTTVSPRRPLLRSAGSRGNGKWGRAHES
jgi:hypothetical protein